MGTPHHDAKEVCAGIRFLDPDSARNRESVDQLTDWLKTLSLSRLVHVVENETTEEISIHIRLGETDSDTTQLCAAFGLDTLHRRDDLEREILVAMLAGPLAFEFPSYEELKSAVRMRCNIVAAARKTALEFHTTEVNRPQAYWRYTPGCGFTLLPKKPLIDALAAATQPDSSGRRYSFSCYRATEYVMLLGMAQELVHCNPDLLRQLEAQWRIEPIMSGPFHDIFLREYGSMEAPLPWKYYVPGDRVWFRNPDPVSAEITGYEGSWVIYLGNGLFSNFWHANKPYTLTSKCVEIFRWRHATYHDAAGELRMDEDKLDSLVSATMNNAEQVQTVLKQVARYRDARGTYRNGGCIDTSRECIRWIRKGTADLALPALCLS